MDFGEHSDVYVQARNDSTSPRILIQYTLYHHRMRESVKSRAWEATSAQGLIDNGPGFDRNILGYAEFPKNTQVGRFDNFEQFVSFVERNSRYVHWKDQSPDVTITGDPFNAAQEAEQ